VYCTSLGYITFPWQIVTSTYLPFPFPARTVPVSHLMPARHIFQGGETARWPATMAIITYDQRTVVAFLPSERRLRRTWSAGCSVLIASRYTGLYSFHLNPEVFSDGRTVPYCTQVISSSQAEKLQLLQPPHPIAHRTSSSPSRSLSSCSKAITDPIPPRPLPSSRRLSGSGRGPASA
jgi:hypothetical protein